MVDKNFIKSLKSGDELAYKKLYDDYYVWLCNYIYKLSNNRKLSEDIVQDTFLKFYKKRKKISIHYNLKNYLFKASYHQFLQHLRKNKVKYDILDTIKWEAIADTYDEQEEVKYEKIDHIYKLIDELPPKCREVFIKSKLDKLKYKEIASDMEISVKTVENHISKALKFLRSKAMILIVLFKLYYY